VCAGVKHIFLTLSGWDGKTLDLMRQPFVRIRNPDMNNKLLCQYNLGSKHSKEELAQHRSLIMCRMTRGETGWHIFGVGKLGKQGAADDYEPLIQNCKNVLGVF